MTRFTAVIAILMVCLLVYGVVWDILPTKRFKAECQKIEGTIVLVTADSELICVKTQSIIFRDKL